MRGAVRGARQAARPGYDSGMREQPTRQQLIGFRLRGHGLQGPRLAGIAGGSATAVNPSQAREHAAAAGPAAVGEHAASQASEHAAAAGPTAAGEHAALIAAAARCGVQNSPPGSAILALHARAGGVTREAFTAAITDEHTLLQTWSLRGAPYIFPTADAALYTAGVLPPTEAAGRRFLPGVVPALDALGLTLEAASDLVQAEIADVLAGRALDIHELGHEIAPLIAARLTDTQRAHWNSEGPHAPGQSIGEAVVHFCMRIVTLRGVACIAPREERRARFVLVSEFLGDALPGWPAGPAGPAEAARAELLRRYLRCYGPATRASFAAWLGVGAGDASAWWDLLEDELAPVELPAGGNAGEAWLLAADLPALAAADLPQRSAAQPDMRLLPPGDPYLRAWDRDTIVAPAEQGALWRNVGGPGALLIDGEVRGTWRPSKRGSTLTVKVTPFAALSVAQREAVAAEVELIAPLRGATRSDTVFQPA
ncbi:hypothetical protein GCM10009659_24770 [Leucobacter albus]